MDCRDVMERLSDYQDGASGSADAVGAHLRECAGCSEAARSLAAVREGLRRLQPLTAPPDLVARVREAVAREEGASPPVYTGAAPPAGARSLLSGLRIPLEAAAAVLLVASIWWYQKGAPTHSVPASPPAPAGTAAPAPKTVPDSSPRLLGEDRNIPRAGIAARPATIGYGVLRYLRAEHTLASQGTPPSFSTTWASFNALCLPRRSSVWPGH